MKALCTTILALVLATSMATATVAKPKPMKGIPKSYTVGFSGSWEQTWSDTYGPIGDPCQYWKEEQGSDRQTFASPRKVKTAGLTRRVVSDQDIRGTEERSWRHRELERNCHGYEYGSIPPGTDCGKRSLKGVAEAWLFREAKRYYLRADFDLMRNVPYRACRGIGRGTDYRSAAQVGGDIPAGALLKMRKGATKELSFNLQRPCAYSVAGLTCSEVIELNVEFTRVR